MLGPLFVVLAYAAVPADADASRGNSAATLASIISVGLFMEIIGLYFHQRDLSRRGGEGAASHYEQQTKFGKTYTARNIGLFAGLATAMCLSLVSGNDVITISVWVIAAVVITSTAVAGRALFYALVIPTTMPGAFFWRNRSFEKHARETGLADMPQVGVLPGIH